MADIDATAFGNTTVDSDLLVRKLTDDEAETSGTGTYTPFLRQNANGQATASQGFNTEDDDATAPNNPADLDMSDAGTENIQLRDVPIVNIGGVDYYEFRLDINEENNTLANSQLALSELQIYTSVNPAVLGDYNSGSFATRALGVNDSGNFDLVYDLDADGDDTIILRDTNSGSGADDYIFYVQTSAFAGQSPSEFVTFFSQFGPVPAEGATFEEWRIRPLEPNPAISIDKQFVNVTNGMETDTDIDTAGDVVNYSITVTNTGTQDLTDVEVIDEVEGTGAVDAVLESGDDGDDVLEIGETWVYSALYTVTQDDIDGRGGGNDLLDNVATVETDQTDALTDTATVPIVYDPRLETQKDVASVTNKQGTETTDDDVEGDTVKNAGDVINYTITVENTGNVTLTNISVTDPFADDAPVLVSGDTDSDDALDVDETWTFSAAHTVTQAEIDAHGNFDGEDEGTVFDDVLVNTATADSDESDPDDDDASAPIDFDPELTIEKDVDSIDNPDASDGGAEVDEAGDVINYAITVANTGNVTLTNITVEDDLADDGSIVRGADQVGNDDAVLDVGEIWTYTASHTVTQAEIDARGNVDAGEDGTNDDLLRNIATADSDESEEDSDDAEAPIDYNPEVAIEKSVKTGPNTFNNADTSPGPVLMNAPVDFRIVLTNTGNVTLTGLVVTDQNLSNGMMGTPFTLFDGTIADDPMTDIADAELFLFDANGDPNGSVLTGDLDGGGIQEMNETWISGDVDGDNLLDVGEEWTIDYRQPFDLGSHKNTATVDTAEAPDASDSAFYTSLFVGPGVRTPGFWQGENNGAKFWDGNVTNNPKAGTLGFANHDLLYVDADGVGAGMGGFNNGYEFLVVGSAAAGVTNGQYTNTSGLLVGDWNLNGIVDGGENAIFITRTDAFSFVNSSMKEQGDARFVLARDVVASWLNYLAGNPLDSGDNETAAFNDPNSPKAYLDDAIDWLKALGDTDHDGALEKTDFTKATAIATSNKKWSDTTMDTVANNPFSAKTTHSGLDNYNNTGENLLGTPFANTVEDVLAAGSQFFP